jgi:acyl-CoA thioesterase
MFVAMDHEAVARSLHVQDPSAEAFGIELLEAGADRAVVRMTVSREMCNGFAIIHGGMTFLLADSAMAFASNAGNEVALASSASIDWLAPVHPGQVLTATAERRWTSGRSDLWEITVRATGTDGDDDVVAIMQGRTRRVGKPVLEREGSA